MHGSMSSHPDRLHNQPLSQQQQSNSVANLPTELGQQSTRDALVEDGNQTDSDNGEVASALVASNRILHGSVRSDETTVQSNVLRNNTTETLSAIDKEDLELLRLFKQFRARSLGTPQARGSSLFTSSSSDVGEVPARAKGKTPSTSRSAKQPSKPVRDDDDDSIGTANFDSILVTRKGDFIEPDTITVKDVETRFDYSTGLANKPAEFPRIDGDLTAQSFERFDSDFSNWFTTNYWCRGVFEDVYKMTWSAMVEAVKASLPKHATKIIALIKDQRKSAVDNIKKAIDKCQPDVKNSVNSAIRAMEDQPAPVELFQLLRDLIKIRQGPEWTKHYQEYRKFNTYKC